MNLTEISKYISLILRHKPEVIGIKMFYDGYVDSFELVVGISKKYPDFDFTDLEMIVYSDEKQRYSFNEDKTKIRANQGHSVNVDVGLEKCNPPTFLYHGTSQKYVESIDKFGLIPKERLYVHLSSDIQTAINVGKRHGKDIVVYRVNSLSMWQRGYEFYISKNGVFLTEGVPPMFLTKIDLKGEK